MPHPAIASSVRSPGDAHGWGVVHVGVARAFGSPLRQVKRRVDELGYVAVFRVLMGRGSVGRAVREVAYPKCRRAGRSAALDS